MSHSDSEDVHMDGNESDVPATEEKEGATEEKERETEEKEARSVTGGVLSLVRQLRKFTRRGEIPVVNLIKALLIGQTELTKMDEMKLFLIQAPSFYRGLMDFLYSRATSQIRPTMPMEMVDHKDYWRAKFESGALPKVVDSIYNQPADHPYSIKIVDPMIFVVWEFLDWLLPRTGLNSAPVIDFYKLVQAVRNQWRETNFFKANSAICETMMDIMRANVGDQAFGESLVRLVKVLHGEEKATGEVGQELDKFYMLTTGNVKLFSEKDVFQNLNPDVPEWFSNVQCHDGSPAARKFADSYVDASPSDLLTWALSLEAIWTRLNDWKPVHKVAYLYIETVVRQHFKLFALTLGGAHRMLIARMAIELIVGEGWRETFAKITDDARRLEYMTKFVSVFSSNASALLGLQVHCGACPQSHSSPLPSPRCPQKCRDLRSGTLAGEDTVESHDNWICSYVGRAEYMPAESMLGNLWVAGAKGRHSGAAGLVCEEIWRRYGRPHA